MDAGTNEQGAGKSKKAEVENVTMSDGRVVGFAGKRKLVKETLIDDARIALDGDTVTLAEGAVSVRMDFRNGETRTFAAPAGLIAQSIGHGLEQKLGDETAGETEVEDMIIAVDDLIGRLSKGEWRVARETGGFAGASLVVRAIMEASGKSQDEVKAFLQRKLDAEQPDGKKLTRAALYSSFRKPGTKTAAIIERLEKEKLAGGKSAVDADAALEELGVAG